MICRAWARARAWESAHACLCDSYPGDIHDLDGCQLPGLNMATLVRGGKERDGQKTKKDGKVYTTAHGWWNGTRTVLSALNRSISIYLCCILKLRSDTQILGICTAVCLSGSIKQHSTYCKQDILKVIRSNKRQIQQLTPTLKIMIANCRYSQTDRKVQWRIQIKPLSKLLIIYDRVVRAKKSKSTSPNQSVSLVCDVAFYLNFSIWRHVQDGKLKFWVDVTLPCSMLPVNKSKGETDKSLLLHRFSIDQQPKRWGIAKKGTRLGQLDSSADVTMIWLD